VIQQRHHLPLHQKFLKDNCDLAPSQFNNVAWDLAATTIAEISITRTLSVLKFTSSEWSTGDKQKSHFQKENKCPFCSNDESMKHVFSCNHPLNITFRDKITAGLHTKLTKIDHSNVPRWTSLFHTAIRELGGEHTATHNYPQIPTHLLVAQSSIGWIHVIQGRIHKDLWKFLNTNNGAQTGPKAIKTFWKLASLFWRKRNGKKHGRTPKEKNIPPQSQTRQRNSVIQRHPHRLGNPTHTHTPRIPPP
jgi:hypothetical protein